MVEQKKKDFINIIKEVLYIKWNGLTENHFFFFFYNFFFQNAMFIDEVKWTDTILSWFYTVVLFLHLHFFRLDLHFQ